MWSSRPPSTEHSRPPSGKAERSGSAHTIQGQRLGEPGLRATEDGVVSVTDRKIDLDMGMPDSPELRRIAEQAEADLKALDRALFRP